MSTLLFPPFRYGLVEVDVHRGAYPKPRNTPFLQSLNLKTLVSLTPEPLEPQLLSQLTQNNPTLQPIHLRTDKPKESIPLSFPKVLQILQILSEPANHPIYLHCLDGATVTCIVVMALRKLQAWSQVCYTTEACRFLRDGLSFFMVDFIL
jgi:tyrosine-protein phosphatase OCA6